MKKLIYILILLFCGCKSQENQPKKIEWDQNKSTEMNKNFAIEEQIDIKLFMERDGSQAYKSTGTGLHYKIVDSTSLPKIIAGNVVELKFKISLLDGTECYQTEVDEIEEIRVDHSDIESGVQEGLKKMRNGEKSRLIIPSHLAHGLVGDMDKIPPLSPIVVDIEIKRVY